MTSILRYRDPLSSRSFLDMSTTDFATTHSDKKRKMSAYDGQSSGSDSRRQSTPDNKRRPSRAGTRSVSTLTQAQLDRKRANDREAQRAIRQRTKDHIESLERQVADLRAQLETNTSPKMAELLRRNEELENENSLLRTRLSHAVTALGVPDTRTDTSGNLSLTPIATSPSDRVQMLSQPRRCSTPGTTRSFHSVPDQGTPASQSAHWQSQHTTVYTPSLSSPHVETPPPMANVSGSSDMGQWNHHPTPHSQHPSVSMGVPDPSAQSLHPLNTSGLPYNAYIVDSNTRAMSYPLENAQLVSSQPMQQMTGYGTPISNSSPHPQDYQRPMGQANLPYQQQQQQQQQTNPAYQQPQTNQPHQQANSPYQAYPSHEQQIFHPQVSHPGEMQMMAPAPHAQPQMMEGQGTMTYHQMQPNT
ncbi:hypothetical protein GQ43DRAFT_377993 [Delitschia confertaspora ATCC 74209]|uniref:BZIP domain-containing protein n=1 Tax=Delitschia confertaspora ATCC 74209 TaxID=1513339 RepID=A0A9P4JI57_9PLEO|nr:hypothetical protein GQ43DRAFT_377993 [Delitschia confertaspora ATCC 74209]